MTMKDYTCMDGSYWVTAEADFYDGVKMEQEIEDWTAELYDPEQWPEIREDSVWQDDRMSGFYMFLESYHGSQDGFVCEEELMVANEGGVDLSMMDGFPDVCAMMTADEEDEIDCSQVTYTLDF